MNDKLFALAVSALILASAARADAPTKAPEPEREVITPMNVRDPMALVMQPWSSLGAKITVTIEAPPAAPACAAGTEKIDKMDFSKDGPRFGMRAVSVAIGSDQLLDVKVGDRVDVLATFTATLTAAAGGTARDRLTATILQNVRVLGFARSGLLRGLGAITLEVNPLEAQVANIAADEAVLGLSRRAPGDVEIHPFEMSSLRMLIK